MRISGPAARQAVQRLTGRARPLEPRHATLDRIAAPHAADQVVLTYFQAPHSYTGEDVVEISAHGSPVLLRGIVEAALAAGCRLAEPGEFTFRAFLRGRIDLVQAEAVRDLVDAVTPIQARAAFDQLEGTLTGAIRAIDARLFDLGARLEASLDFPDEGYHFVDASETAAELAGIAGALEGLLADARRGRLIREGLHVAIVGSPNAGKSSLFNRLAGAGRAIVTDRPGTTRDLLTEVIDVAGIPMTLVDTAGIRGSAADAIEAEGIARAVAARDVASALVVVLDRSRPLGEDDRRVLDETSLRPRVIVANKSDLPPAWPTGAVDGAIELSAITGEGLDALRRALFARMAGDEPRRDTAAITNLRHVNLVKHAFDSIERAAAAARSGTPEEFVLADIHDARARLEEITGARSTDDVLRAIFARFCIGK